MPVLGIETSCDETAVAIYSPARGLCAEMVYSQADLHQMYGGVVPELASRDHIRKLLPLIQQLLNQAHLSTQEIVGIAYTKGPGLIGALMVGACVAKSLAYAWHIPVVGIHHLEAHLMVIQLEKRVPPFPFMSLLVSGGHTLLMVVKGLGNYVLLGETLDDAAGEAFDKTAKLLGLPYPGGPTLAQLAMSGNPQRWHFPRPMIHRTDFNFSFSGLKTHALHYVKRYGQDAQARADIACAFEDAIIDILVTKCQRALRETELQHLAVVGGVAANGKLRHRMKTALADRGVEVYYPAPALCTDNGAMVAYIGWLRLQRGEREDLPIQVKPRWEINSLS